MGAFLAIGLSVLMHVGWNLMVRHQKPETFALWWALLAHLIILAPWGMTMMLSEVVWTLHALSTIRSGFMIAERSKKNSIEIRYYAKTMEKLAALTDVA